MNQLVDWMDRKAGEEKEFEINKQLDTGGGIDFEGKVSADIRDAAMGTGDEMSLKRCYLRKRRRLLPRLSGKNNSFFNSR
jgi:hypothetical protein